MKKLRFGFRALLKCLGMALLAGLPLLPALAQSLAIVANPGDNNVMLIDTSRTPFAVVATIPTTGPSAPCCSSSPEWVALTPGGRCGPCRRRFAVTESAAMVGSRVE